MAYIPNKAIHPGRIIGEALSREGMTQKSLSERTGISEKHLSQVINGEASITVETALSLEKALGGSASFWINLEKNYQETRARVERQALLKPELGILSKFPYNEISKRGYVEQSTDREKRVDNLCKFFGVNSLSYVSTTESAAFRTRLAAGVKSEIIATWLRCGELEARKQKLAEYCESSLKIASDKIKMLSRQKPEKFSEQTVQLLNDAGVALVYIAHFPGSGVSGAVRWINKTPVIQLSLYYPWADIFWFNLYHEIGHLLLHGKKGRFIEFDKKELASAKSKEDEADEFASNELIPAKHYAELLKEPLTKRNIVDFAASLGIHPGIVAGRLCHDKKVDWKSVSSIRPRLTLVSK